MVIGLSHQLGQSSQTEATQIHASPTDSHLKDHLGFFIVLTLATGLNAINPVNLTKTCIQKTSSGFALSISLPKFLFSKLGSMTCIRDEDLFWKRNLNSVTLKAVPNSPSNRTGDTYITHWIIDHEAQTV